MSFSYLAILLFSLFGMAVLDRKNRLALFVAPIRTLVTLFSAVVLFLIWDACGIGLGIFFRGPSDLLTGVMLATQLPLEEPLFLLLLSYCALLFFQALRKRAA